MRVFNNGEMWRDFTYIDDVVDALVAALDKPPLADVPPSRLYNIGNNQPVRLGDFIDILERLLGVKANRQSETMQPGDVEQTFADMTLLERDFGFTPRTSLEVGLGKFVDWYQSEWKNGQREQARCDSGKPKIGLRGDRDARGEVGDPPLHTVMGLSAGLILSAGLLWVTAQKSLAY